MSQGHDPRCQKAAAVHDRVHGSAALLAMWRADLTALWGLSPVACFHHERLRCRWQRWGELQASAAQQYHRPESLRVAQAIGAADDGPNLVVDSLHHSVAQSRLHVGQNAILVPPDCLRQLREGGWRK